MDIMVSEFYVYLFVFVHFLYFLVTVLMHLQNSILTTQTDAASRIPIRYIEFDAFENP